MRQDDPARQMRSTATPVLERARDVVALQVAADAATTGTPRVIWVEGAAGVGKSTLVRHWLAGVRGDAAVLRVTGDDLIKDVPWAALAGLVDVSDADAVGPFVVGMRILERLASATTGWLGVLLVEDLHWVDVRSRRALSSAVGRMDHEPFLVVVTARPASAGLDDSWARVLADPLSCTTVVLEGLSADGVAALAADRGIALSATAAGRLRDHTQGNPLHLSALLGELSVETLTAKQGPLPAPRTFAATIDARVRLLTPPAGALVAALAVVNQALPLPAVAAVADVDDPTSALDELVAADLVEWMRDDASVVSVAVAHPLIRSAIYQGLAPRPRRELHRRAATVVDRDAALAHRVAATDRVDEALAAELEQMAELAAAPSSSSARLLRWAADLSADRDSYERRLLSFARHSLRAHDVGAALAQRASLATIEPSTRRDLVLGVLAWNAGETTAATAYLTSAAAGDDIDAAVAAATTLASMHVTRGDGDEAARAAARALALGSTDGHLNSQALSLHVVGIGQRDGAVAALEQLATRFDVPASSIEERDIDLLVVRGVLRTYARRYGDAIIDLERVVANPGAHLGAIGARRARVQLAQSLVIRGRWDDALVHAGIAVELAEESPWERAVALEPLVTVLATRGEWAVAEARLAQLRRTADETPTAEARVALRNARVAWHHSRHEHAEVAAMRPSMRRDIAAPMTRLEAWPSLVRSMLQLGQVEAAADAIDDMESTASARNVCVEFSVRDLRARHAARLGRRSAAEAEFRAALAAVTNDDPVLDVALAHAAYAQLLHARADRHATIEHLRTARQTLGELRAVPYLDVVDQQLADTGLARPERSKRRSPLDLTTREHDVATLATKGLMNKEIAAELFISTKAVEYHLRNIYGKLGVSSRHDLKMGHATSSA